MGTAERAPDFTVMYVAAPKSNLDTAIPHRGRQRSLRRPRPFGPLEGP